RTSYEIAHRRLTRARAKRKSNGRYITVQRSNASMAARRPLVTALTLLLLLTVGLASIASAQPVYGGTLLVGLADDPPQLDPHLTASNASRTILHNIFATLVEI